MIDLDTTFFSLLPSLFLVLKDRGVHGGLSCLLHRRREKLRKFRYQGFDELDEANARSASRASLPALPSFPSFSPNQHNLALKKMKLSPLTLLPALLLTSSASAYLNEGWKPGQPSTKFIGKLAKDQEALSTQDPLLSIVPPSSSTPKKKQSYKEIGLGLLDMLNLSMYTATGIDVKKAVTKAQSNLEFQPEGDKRDGTVRLTDANWEELVELEDLKEGEERVWALIV